MLEKTLLSEQDYNFIVNIIKEYYHKNNGLHHYTHKELNDNIKISLSEKFKNNR